jgi:alpha-L-fucosidase
MEELSKSCTKYGMDLGVALSPWDMNSSVYGEEVGYNAYFMQQLRELLENRKYGRDGSFVEVWMDYARSYDSVDQKYWWVKWFEEIGAMAPDAVVFSPYGSSARWIGSTDGSAGEKCWAKINATRQRAFYDRTREGEAAYLREGDPDGQTWSVAECDVSLSSGWFWKEKDGPKTMDELRDIYFRSVGRGQPLLLNVPPTPEGVIAQDFVDRVQEFGQAIRNSFRDNLVGGPGVVANASSERGSLYRVGNVLNNDTELFWAVEERDEERWLVVEFPADVIFDVLAISEHIALGQRVVRFACEVREKKHWRLLHSGQTIGAKRLLRSELVTAEAIRFTFTECLAPPIISWVGAFRAYGEFAVRDMCGDCTNVEANKLEKTGEWIWDNENIVSNEPAAGATFAFDGTKAWIVGTMDESYGGMRVFVDDFLVKTVTCQSSTRRLRQVLFASEDLADCRHVIRAESVSDAPVSIHNLYLLQNGGAGMFEIESPVYAVAAGDNVTIRILRHGGANGMASVTFQTLPGTALGGRNFVDLTSTVPFKDSENVRTIVIATIGGKKATNNLTFCGEIVAPSQGAVLGLQRKTNIVVTAATRPIARRTKGLAVTPKWRRSFLSLVLVVGGIMIGVVVWREHGRRSGATAEELSSLIHGERLYAV